MKKLFSTLTLTVCLGAFISCTNDEQEVNMVKPTNANSEIEVINDGTMIKFKDVMEGSFKIIDIYPEGISRNIPLFLCKNDINDETFEVHINGTLKEQERYLFFRDKFIDKSSC